MRIDARESRFGNLDTRTVEILLQTGIELSQATVFEVSHTLLLVLDITTRSEFVSRHRDGEGVVGSGGCRSRGRERGSWSRGEILLLDWRGDRARSSIEPTIDAQLDGTEQRKGENEGQRNEEGGRRRWRDFPRGWWLVVRGVRGCGGLHTHTGERRELRRGVRVGVASIVRQ